jgi:CDP-paratose 2-epimerase
MEAIRLCEHITGKEVNWQYVEENRKGDHIWWISDLSRFRTHYPTWNLVYDVPQIVHEIYEINRDEWIRG